MQNTFDAVNAIDERARMYREKTGKKPGFLTISRDVYRRLVELISSANSVGNLVIGCAPIQEIETSVGRLKIAIDEMLGEAGIQIS
ncbi:MAG: hypothetical protein HY562_04630 [Ignavibacteriales bacterium]|nr:hypothetical protein [Ignavibacteriales bacterium]